MESDPLHLRDDGLILFAGDAYACRRLAGALPGGWRCLMAKEGEPEGSPGRTVEMSPSGVWRCSCDGWRYRGKCRHVRLGKALRSLQLCWRGPEEAPPAADPTPRRSLMEMAYGDKADEVRRRVAERARAERMLRPLPRDERAVPADGAQAAPFDAGAFREEIREEVAGILARAAQGGRRG